MNQRIADLLNKAHPGAELTWSSFRGQERLTVPAKSAHDVLKSLNERAGMDMLVDITAVDFLEYEGAKDRFEVVYCLLDTESNERLIVSVFLNEPDLELPSVYGIWRAADWLEREVFDMFGITFDGHPDMTRILMPEDWDGHPLRKDYEVGRIPVQFKGAPA